MIPEAKTEDTVWELFGENMALNMHSENLTLALGLCLTAAAFSKCLLEFRLVPPGLPEQLQCGV